MFFSPHSISLPHCHVLRETYLKLSPDSLERLLVANCNTHFLKPSLHFKFEIKDIVTLIGRVYLKVAMWPQSGNSAEFLDLRLANLFVSWMSCICSVFVTNAGIQVLNTVANPQFTSSLLNPIFLLSL